jgi:formylglycine-generating enzyme required for sulfatase activity
MSQGNPDIAQHAISKEKCLVGLRDVVLQTPEQREICGAENMVPIYKTGDVRLAKACIDIFEFPNRPCELPFVWVAPTAAEKVCELEGKRLCSQDEWNLACRGDPGGGKDRAYAYGDELDLTACNTNKPHRIGPDGHNWVCWVKDTKTAYETCGTDTEPSGAFPQCRSRFGVFDQHGNVAEIMSRKEDDVVYTQLKGSAFFYVDVSRKRTEPPGPKVTAGVAHDTYPDHCNYDPRWHVEKLDDAHHTNYHLGFRCCKSVTPKPR